MNTMRLILPDYNPVRECHGCRIQDEKKVSAYILSFQLAERLLHRYSGKWELSEEALQIKLNNVTAPLYFDLNTGSLSYGQFQYDMDSIYSAEKGLDRITDELIQTLGLPVPKDSDFNDPLFSLFAELIVIFHARCGLKIYQQKACGLNRWRIALGDRALWGWISPEGIIENRFGDKTNIKRWFHLRPEKLAVNVFGYYKFCNHHKGPTK